MTGLLAVSPLRSTNGSSRPADPRLPRQQRGAAGPPGDAVVGAEAVEGARAEGQREVEFDLGGLPRGERVRRASTTYSPPGSAGAGRLVARRRRRRRPGRRRRRAGCPPAPSRGRWAPGGTRARRTRRSGVKTTVSVPVTVTRSSAEAEVEVDHAAGRDRARRARPGSRRAVGRRGWSGGAGGGGAPAPATVSAKEVQPGRSSSRGSGQTRPAARSLMPGGRSRGPGRGPSRRRW